MPPPSPRRLWPADGPLSIDLRARALDDVGPFRRIAADERGVVLGGAAAAFAAELRQAFFRVRLDDGGVDRGIEPIEDRARQSGGGGGAGAGRGRVVGR